MSTKFDEAIKALVEEGQSNGVLTFGEMSKLLEDQFIPPDQLDQVFVALEEAGIEVVDNNEDPVTAPTAKTPAETIAEKAAVAQAALARTVALPEKIDDPVRMYLTQMGEISLLTHATGRNPPGKEDRALPVASSASKTIASENDYAIAQSRRGARAKWFTPATCRLTGQ